MCCTEALTRILVFVANFAFLLVGVALLAVGILYTVNFSRYTEAIPEDYQTLQYVPTIAIVVGAIIFVIAFLGCWGALRSNTCMLSTYAAILLIIFLLQVGLGVFGLLQIKNSQDLESKVSNQITKLFERYSENTEIKGVVDLIQQNLECCGTYSSLSWLANLKPIPASCYDEDQVIFLQGCSKAMYSFLSDSVKIIAIVALAISVTEVVGAILALCLSNCIRSNERKAGYNY